MAYIIVDVEATGGPTPASGLMTEFGAVELKTGKSFYGVLWDSYPDPANPACSLIREGTTSYDHVTVLESFESWLKQFPGRTVFISDNPAYDMQWINFYCDKYLGKVLGGHSARRIGDFAAGIAAARGERNWTNTSWWKKLRITKHSHNPVDDSVGNLESLRTLIEMVGQQWNEDN